MLKARSTILVLGLLCWLPSTAAMAAADAAPGADRLFAEAGLLEVTLTGPFRSLSLDRAAEPEDRPGSIAYTDSDGTTRQHDVGIRPRGNSRRDRDVCTFPPLRLNFARKDVRNSLFDKQNVLKLVTHCRSNDSFQNYVLKEYLAYRIFNQLTDNSFRVRLLKISYVDSERNRDPLIRYGFLIEHKKRLAKRLGLAGSDVAGIEPARLDPETTALAELFQFMVNNTDFSFIRGPEGEACCHNSILLALDSDRFVPVPYDFDRTGFVDPPNGLPDEALGQRNFRDRRFRGFCHPPAVLATALQRTEAARSAIEGLIDNQVDLSATHKRRARGFIEDYYTIIAQEGRRNQQLECRAFPAASPG